MTVCLEGPSQTLKDMAVKGFQDCSSGIFFRDTMGSFGASAIIGEDGSLKDVFRMLRRVARTASTVLVTGETGTGKELVVQTLHEMSGRKGPFVPVNCGAIPADLIESELFGSMKGAFTGSTNDRKGRFELANTGTLFLDEIGEMPLGLQVKLLRALQEKEVQRIGGGTPVKVDVRVVAATNRDLEAEVKKGTFREDLYYRLNVIPLTLPPLRERGEDILALARHFVALFCEESGRKPLSLSKDACGMLLRYPWPGNVRELENFMNRVSVLCEGKTIRVEDLPEKIVRTVRGEAEPKPVETRPAPEPSLEEEAAMLFGGDFLAAFGDESGEKAGRTGKGQASRTPGGNGKSGSKTGTKLAPLQGGAFAWPTLEELGALGLGLKEFLGRIEENLIGEALACCGGSHQQAADLLGVKRTTLIEKLRRKGMIHC